MKKIEKLKNIGKSCPGVYALVNHSKQKCYIELEQLEEGATLKAALIALCERVKELQS